MSKKLPYFPFYPGDWVKDTRMLSLEARALWIDLLCLMHDSDRRGYLSRNGKSLTPEQIASYAGCSAAVVSRATQELIDSGVASCTEHGTVYSRRMVRDERKRHLCSEAGKKGGNPTLKGLLKGRVKGRVKPALASDNGIPKGEEGGAGGRGKPPPPDPPSGLAFDLTAEGLAQAWCFYLSRKKHGSPRDSEFDMAAEFAELLRLGHKPSTLLEAVLHPKRDRGEHFWQFKERLAGGKKMPAAMMVDSPAIPTIEELRKRLPPEKPSPAKGGPP